jgi:hypothetical protein
MGKLTDAAKHLLEGSKETFDANIASKRGQRGSDKHPKGEVGDDKLSASTAYGTHDAGIVGHSVEKMDDSLPDYLKGTPSATPPGATPPVGSEKNDQHLGTVGYNTYKGQPQQTQGRTDVMHPTQTTANQYDAIRDRVGSSLAKQTMQKNPGATFQHYDGSHTAAESFDFSDDVNALLEGESLSEDFRIKATTIFEAAVASRIEAIAEAVEDQLTEQFEEAIEQVKNELAEKVDAYLNYMVEQWIQENQLAVDNGLKSEIVEDFMTDLHKLFKEHYINIPDEQVNVVEELMAKVESLESELNESINDSVALAQALNEHQKIEAIYAACEGLTQTQVEKLKSLAENVEFTTEEEFVGKLDVLKESYFQVDVKVATASTLNEGVDIEEDKRQSISEDPVMAQYAKTISQTLVK